jgi:hypothetical protein
MATQPEVLQKIPDTELQELIIGYLKLRNYPPRIGKLTIEREDTSATPPTWRVTVETK